MALCTNDGIRFIVNTKEPYTGAIYAAERFSTCSQVSEPVSNRFQGGGERKADLHHIPATDGEQRLRHCHQG